MPYLPDEIVQLIIDFKTLKDAAIERDKRSTECSQAQDIVNQIYRSPDQLDILYLHDAFMKANDTYNLWRDAESAYQTALLKTA